MLPRIFDPFFSTKEAGKGTGLGLALAHAFVRGAGGDIRVRDSTSRGTTIEVVLPLAAWGKLKLHSTADVIPEGLGGRYGAKVTVIDSVFDTASGTFGVRLELPNGEAKVPAGIRCRVDFPELRSLVTPASFTRESFAK